LSLLKFLSACVAVAERSALHRSVSPLVPPCSAHPPHGIIGLSWIFRDLRFLHVGGDCISSFKVFRLQGGPDLGD
jgi:hypothetical protein